MWTGDDSDDGTALQLWFALPVFGFKLFFYFQTESLERQAKLEDEQRSLAETLKSLQKNVVDEKRILCYPI